MKRIAGALILFAAARAEASPQTLPVNRLIIDMPSDWQVYGGDGDRNLDTLRGAGGASIALGFADGNCASFYSQQSALVGVLQPTTASYAPTGWEVRSFGGGSTFLGCHASGNRAWAAEWWPLPQSDYNDQSAWQTRIGEILTALDGARRASAEAESGNLLALPNNWAAQVPLSLRVAETSIDGTRFVRADGSQIVIGSTAGGCATTVASQLSGATETTSEVYDAIKWTDGSQDFYCSDSGAFFILGPAGDASMQLLADSLVGERTDPGLADKSKLPGSGLEAQIPNGWTVTAAGKSTTVAAKDGTLTISKVKHCDSAGTTYDPSWLPAGWHGSLDSGTVHLCNGGASAQVDVPRAMVEGRSRHAVDSVMQSIGEESEYHEHKPHLPIPLEIAFDTVAGNSTLDRGYGIRGALEYWSGGGGLSVRGELGYDSHTHVAFDARATLGFMFGKRDAKGRVYAVGGYDQIGSGKQVKLTGDPYFGAGFGYGVWESDGIGFISLEYLSRVHPKDDPSMPLGADTPTHEWRFRLQFYTTESRKAFSGIAFEYRRMPSSVFSLGWYFKL